MADPFRRLLFKISRQLTTGEIKGLLYIYNVPPAAKQGIENGTDLFEHLQERGVIREQRVESIKEVIRQLKPKRRDLLNMVDEYLELHENSPVVGKTDTLATVTSVVSSNSGVSVETDGHRYQGNSWKDTQETHFVVDCFCIQCHGCSIRKPLCCCYGSFIVLIFCLVAAVVFWFGGPKTVHTYLNAKEYRRDIGYVLIGVLVFILIVFILYLLRKKSHKFYSWCKQKRAQRKRNGRSRLRESAGSEFKHHAVNTMEMNDRSSSHPETNNKNPGFQNDKEEILNSPTNTVELPY